MCQADDVQGGEGSSPSALQTGDNADAGIQIDMLGGNCPVQAKGLIDGEPFYFRARWEGWSLSIGSDHEDNSNFTGVHGRDVVGNPRWYHEEEWGDGPYDAGWMPEDEARRMILKGTLLFRAAISRRSDEEARSADTATAEERDGSLTQKKATP